MNVQIECPITSVNPGRKSDHSWSILSNFVHARLFEKTDTFSNKGVIKSIGRLDENEYLLELTEDCYWSDGQPCKSDELAACLCQGQQTLDLQLFARCEPIDTSRLLVVSSSCCNPIDEWLLASPAFVLTPSCRKRCDSKYDPLATSGPFQILNYRKERSELTLSLVSRKRPRSRDSVNLIYRKHATDSRDAIEDDILITAPLGGHQIPEYSWNTVATRLLDYFLVLSPNTALRRCLKGGGLQMVSDALAREEIPAVTGQTYVPINHTIQIFSHEKHPQFRPTRRQQNIKDEMPRVLRIFFTNFFPNRAVSELIAKQISSVLGISCIAHEISYDDYLRGVARDIAAPALTLEIIQPYLPSRFYKEDTAIPLCRARSTSCSRNLFFKGREVITREGTFDRQLFVELVEEGSL